MQELRFSRLAVTRIISCWVPEISRAGIKQPGVSFVRFFSTFYHGSSQGSR